MHVERSRDKERAGKIPLPTFLIRVTLRKERLDGQVLIFFHDTYTINVDKVEASIAVRIDVTPDHES
jgi:hypothetical protein